MSVKLNTMSETFKRKVSYSQFSNWFNCPHHWYLDSVKGLKVFDESINTCFGTAIHEAIQLYIETLYKESAAAADLHDLKDHFKQAFERDLIAKKITFTETEKAGFIEDGNEIINSFSNMTNRIKYFPSNKYEFVAVEDEIVMPIKNNVDFICYIDVVLKEKSTGRYRIIDIKTSTRGWNSYQKEDPAKYAQVLLYKAFFSKKYNVPLSMIDVEFFILKRKLFENTGFPQSRIQYFVPANNEKKVKTTLSTFSQFVGECFKPDGSFVDDVKKYPKIPGKAKKNCKYCPHRRINCDGKADVIED